MNKTLLLAKSKKILYVIGFAFLLILFRVWQLTNLTEEEMKKAMPARKKTIITKASRGQIYDRYHIPLATNKIRYDATILYNQIRDIPQYKYDKDESGKKVKIYLRSQYINKLSTFLSTTISLDFQRIKDLIYSKASLFPNTPFTLKKGLTEKQYYQLKALEKDFPGLSATKSLERFYPQEKVASDLIGYVGVIDQDEYLKIANHKKILEKFLEEEENNLNPEFPEGYFSKEHILTSLKILEEKSYRISDLIGKTGIEKSFEDRLRGYYGKTAYEIDLFGHFIQKLPGEKEAVSGKEITLTVSAKLQEFAEKLLAEYEAKNTSSITPWIKGGAIVALDPNNGQVLALASYPRINNNDFISSNNVSRWLESPLHIANIWNGKSLLSKELFSDKKKSYHEKEKELTWNNFLEFIIPKDSNLYAKASKVNTLKKAITLQEDFSFVSYYAGEDDASYLIDVLYNEDNGHKTIQPENTSKKISILEHLNNNYELAYLYKKRLDEAFSGIDNNLEKLFLVDLCRLCVYSPAFSNELIEKIGSLSLTHYRKLTQQFIYLNDLCKKQLENFYHYNIFAEWRKENEKAFLKEKRRIEKEKKTYARPYIDYLDKQEKQMFSEFWLEVRPFFLLKLIDPSFNHPSLTPLLSELHSLKFDQRSLEAIKDLENLAFDQYNYIQLFKTFRSYKELSRPLLTKYPRIKRNGLEKDLAASFYPKERFGFGRSFAYSQAATLGSIFKVVTGYSALKTNYLKGLDLEPLSFFDTYRFDPKAKKGGSIVVGYLNGKIPITRFYKGGRMPKSYSSFLGQLDLGKALQQTSNPYFSLLTTEVLDDPEDLLKTAEELGFGKKTGIELPLEYAGNLPNDLHQNKTGLYAFAIGQHTLLVTPLQTACMLGAIANQGKLFQPQIIHSIQGNQRLDNLSKPLFLKEYSFQKPLEKIGVSYCLFTEKEHNRKQEQYTEGYTRLNNEVFLPKPVQEKLLHGLDLVVSSEKGSAYGNKIRYFQGKPNLLKDYRNLYHQLVGKTSTAEIIYNPYKSPTSKGSMNKHTWFGAISYQDEKPELVVVVFLRFGTWGKEAAPLASQMVTEYRKIKEKHSKLTSK